MKMLVFLCPRVVAIGLLAVCLVLAPSAQAQSQNLYDWAWVSRLGPTALPGQNSPVPPAFGGNSEKLAADAAGNVVIAGVYHTDFIFDNPAVRYQAVTGPLGPVANGYVAKYSPAGALVWSLVLRSNADVGVRDLALDAAGNSYVVGSYYQQLHLNATLVAVSSTSLPFFLAKISPAGNLLWAITIEPSAPVTRFSLQRLAVDAAGNSAVLGEFEHQVSINGATFTGAASKLHALVLRYDALGTATRSFAAYTTGAESSRSFTGIALAATGECYLSGDVASAATIQFGSLPLITGPAPVGNRSYSRAFVAKLDATATAEWVLTSSGPAGTGQGVGHVVAGPQGRCYAVGFFGGGAMTLGPQALSTAGTGSQADIFYARLAPSGAVELLVGGGGTAKVSGLALGPQGEATIATAGGMSWGNVQLPGAVWPASFLTGLVQLDAAGVPQRGWQAGVGFFAPTLAVDGLNRPVLAGTYDGPSPFVFGTQQRASPYAWNTLIARTAGTVLAARPAAPVVGLEMYPNPARHVVEVRTPTGAAAVVQLFDALGRSIHTQVLSAGQTQVDLTGVAAGSYTLRVQQGEGRSYRHVVVAP